jgi:hypothetical protein
MSREKGFEDLFSKSHKYLEKGMVLRNVYVPKKIRSIAKGYPKSLMDEMHLIEPLLKKYPHLEKSFKYNYKSKSYQKAFNIFDEIAKNPPKDIDVEQLCTYNLLWSSIRISKLLDMQTENAYDTSILDQSLVAMCTAFECFARDIFEWILNNFPEYAKKYIGSLSIPIKAVGKYGFEPLKNSGHIFAENDGKDFRIFENGKRLYREVIGFGLFRSEKNEMKLWKIFQTRHCIIHNGGNPDLTWKQKTKNAQFKKNVSTLVAYIDYLHDEFHILYYRLYIHFFKDKPTYITIDGDSKWNQHILELLNK